MSHYSIGVLRRLYPFQWMNHEGSPVESFNLMKELKDLHRSSFSAISTILVILMVSLSKYLLSVVLALLINTISLRLAISSFFVQNHPTLSRFLHAIPLFGAFCTASVKLVFDMESPALAVVVLLLSASPFLMAVVHHGVRREETPLPVRMQDLETAV